MPRRPIISAISPGSSANSPRSASASSARPWSRLATAKLMPLMKGLADAKAYVAYAQAHPGMYRLMFRTERLDMSRPSLHEAAAASFEGLASAVGAGAPRKAPGDATDARPGRRDRARMVAGARLHHAAARWAAARHPAPAARGHRGRPAARCDAAFDGAAAGGNELREKRKLPPSQALSFMAKKHALPGNAQTRASARERNPNI